MHVDIEALIAEVDALPPRAALARETARLRRDEIDGSLAIVGTPLGPAEVAALVDRGLALGDHPLDAYIVAWSLASAASWVWSQRPYASGDARPLLTIEEVRRLHTLAAAGQRDARPGLWRLTVAPPRNQVVSPPPWAVPAQTAALVERFHARPPAGTLVGWVADLLARFARVRPFADANGRVARLAASLVLRRLGAPPLAIPREAAAAFCEALVAAEAGDPAALTAIVRDALGEGCRRMLAAGGDDPLAAAAHARRRRLRRADQSGAARATAYRHPRPPHLHDRPLDRRLPYRRVARPVVSTSSPRCHPSSPRCHPEQVRAANRRRGAARKPQVSGGPSTCADGALLGMTTTRAG